MGFLRKALICSNALWALMTSPETWSAMRRSTRDPAACAGVTPSPPSSVSGPLCAMRE